MAGSPGAGRVAETHALQAPGVVAGELLLLDAHEVIGGAVLLAHAVGALGQHVAEALTGGDHLGQAHHGVGIAEGQGEADVLLGDQAALEHLHGRGDGVAGGDGVHAHPVADEVGLGHGREVVHPAVGAEHADGLVLRPGAQAGKVGVGDLGDPPARHRAARTGDAHALAHGQGVGQGLAGDLVGVVVHPGLEVAGGKHPELCTRPSTPGVPVSWNSST